MISERLQELRKEYGYTKRDLLKVIPLNYSTYANYESGIREPGLDVLKTIAKFYNVSIDFILGLTDNRRRADDILPITDPEYNHIDMYRSLDDHGKRLVDFVLKSEKERAKKITQKQVSLQVYNQHASAGLGNYLDDYDNTNYEMRHFLADSISIRADFAVRLKGDGMEPKYKDNDIVYVKSVPKIDPDQIGIFLYENEVYCKKLKIDRRRGRIYLEPLNKNYKPQLINYPDRLRTIGLVLGVAKE